MVLGYILKWNHLDSASRYILRADGALWAVWLDVVSVDRVVPMWVGERGDVCYCYVFYLTH